MDEIVNFIVSDVAFKLSQGMVIKPEDNIDLFIDTSQFKFKILCFIIYKDANEIQAYAYDYKPDDDTINYFIKLSLTNRKEISAIEQKILDKIKEINFL